MHSWNHISEKHTLLEMRKACVMYDPSVNINPRIPLGFILHIWMPHLKFHIEWFMVCTLCKLKQHWHNLNHNWHTETKESPRMLEILEKGERGKIKQNKQVDKISHVNQQLKYCHGLTLQKKSCKDQDFLYRVLQPNYFNKIECPHLAAQSVNSLYIWIWAFVDKLVII